MAYFDYKLALMMANLRKKRPYYCEVEYLESTGTQYIDTGILTKQSLKIKSKIDNTGATSSEFAYGVRKDTATITCATGLTGQNGYIRWGTSAFSDSCPYGLIEIHQDSSGVIINGVAYEYNATETVTSQTGYTITLFAGRNSTTGVTANLNGKMYYFKVWDNGILIRDMIPVLDWNMRPAMYDKVSRHLYYNQGSGEFTYGREIHYVEYLESTGTQYIDTGVNAASGLCCDMNMSFTNKGYASAIIVFGGRTSQNMRFGFGLDGGGVLWNLAVAYDNIALDNSPELNQKYNVYFYSDNSGARLDVDGITITSTTSVVSQTINAWLFGWNYNGSNQWPFKGKIYYAKLYDNGTLVRDFIPAIDENGVGFMFDRVSHTIHDNAGTGAFKYPVREVEYLESTGTQYIDTGLDYFADFEVGVKLRGNVTNKCLGNDSFHCLERINGANPYWRFASGSSSRYDSTIPITEYHVLKWKDNKISSDGVEVTTLAKSSNTGHTLRLYAAIATDYYPNVIYFCKLWNPADGALVRDFVPSYKDGVLGMWDKVNDVFYQNAGTGSFSTSKIVEPEYE